MQKRIEELAEQANLISIESNGFDRTQLTLAEKRFADLIIKECIDAVIIADQTHGLTSFDIGIITGTKQRCVKNIKERFGYEFN